MRLNPVQEANLFKMLSIANHHAPGICAPAQLTQHAARTTQPMSTADFQRFSFMVRSYRQQQLLQQQQQLQLRQQQQQHYQEETQQHAVSVPGQGQSVGPTQRQVHASALQRQQSQGLGLQREEGGSGQASPSVKRTTSLGASDGQQPDLETGAPNLRHGKPNQDFEQRHSGIQHEEQAQADGRTDSNGGEHFANPVTSGTHPTAGSREQQLQLTQQAQGLGHLQRQASWLQQPQAQQPAPLPRAPVGAVPWQGQLLQPQHVAGSQSQQQQQQQRHRIDDNAGKLACLSLLVPAANLSLLL